MAAAMLPRLQTHSRHFPLKPHSSPSRRDTCPHFTDGHTEALSKAWLPSWEGSLESRHISPGEWGAGNRGLARPELQPDPASG